MREGGKRKSSPFNPYIVLADVTIATIVVFIVLLLRYDTSLSKTEGELKEYRQKDQARERLETEIRAKNSRVSKAIDASKGEWNSKDRLEAGVEFNVSRSNGPNTYLVRLYGSGDVDWGSKKSMWDKSGHFNQSGLDKGATVVSAIKDICQEYQQDNSSLVEIRIEGHCQKNDLELSLARASAVRKMFPESMRYYISVSGFGNDRPAYETTQATDAKELETKKPIRDRIDIVLVYGGLARDNNFVHPDVHKNKTLEGSDYQDPPAWVNDVSWPIPSSEFLSTTQVQEAP